MRVILTGAAGQLGRLLQTEFAGADIWAADLPEADITSADFPDRVRAFQPDVVIHAAAMTDVDGCALDPATAHRVNALGTLNVARACCAAAARMVYVSTNEVFDGEGGRTYSEYDPTRPVNAYGRSKLAGEQLARGTGVPLAIARVAWLYSAGDGNFPAKMVELADRLGALRVVSDEIANPTYAPDAAAAIRALVEHGAEGVFHMVNEGACSRYDFAREILHVAGRGSVPIEAITSDQFERASTPPPHTPLHNNLGAALGVRMQSWQDALQDWARARGAAAEPETGETR